MGRSFSCLSMSLASLYKKKAWSFVVILYMQGKQMWWNISLIQPYHICQMREMPYLGIEHVIHTIDWICCLEMNISGKVEIVVCFWQTDPVPPGVENKHTPTNGTIYQRKSHYLPRQTLNFCSRYLWCNVCHPYIKIDQTEKEIGSFTVSSYETVL